MALPLIYVGTHTIKDGKLEVAKQASRELAKFVEENHPRFLHFEISFSDNGAEMRVVQVHADEESMALHMQLAGERSRPPMSSSMARRTSRSSETRVSPSPATCKGWRWELH